jgi:DNA-binding NarL/FixJ family response regulator
MNNNRSRIVRVVIADDHRLMRIGLRQILEISSEIDVIGEASTGKEAIQAVKELQPDVLLLDMDMPDLSGLDVTRLLQKDQLPVNILVISAYNEPYYIREVLKVGASGYLTKDEAPLYLIRAVLGTADGVKGWFSDQVIRDFPE